MTTKKRPGPVSPEGAAATGLVDIVHIRRHHMGTTDDAITKLKHLVPSVTYGNEPESTTVLKAIIAVVEALKFDIDTLRGQVNNLARGRR